MRLLLDNNLSPRLYDVLAGSGWVDGQQEHVGTGEAALRRLHRHSRPRNASVHSCATHR
jgi:predicted nuclease of predicted toxin-antitoxin system